METIYIYNNPETYTIDSTLDQDEAYDNRPGDEKYFWSSSFNIKANDVIEMLLVLQPFETTPNTFQKTPETVDWVRCLRAYHDFAWHPYKREWMTPSFLAKCEIKKDNLSRSMYYERMEIPWGLDGVKVVNYLQDLDEELSKFIRAGDLDKDQYTVGGLARELGVKFPTGQFYLKLLDELTEDGSRIRNQVLKEGFTVHRKEQGSYIKRKQ